MNISSKIHLALAENNQLVRHGFYELILTFGEFEIDILACNGLDLINQLKLSDTLPSICITEIGMPIMDGYDSIVEVKKLWPHMKFLILTSYANEDAIVKMFNEGANGFLSKNSSPDQLKKALSDIYNFDYHYTSVTTQTINNCLSRKGQQSRLKINEREFLFLRHVWKDISYSEIAKNLGVSVRTVEGYRDSLFSKLRIRSRMGLATYAASMGLVLLDLHE